MEYLSPLFAQETLQVNSLSGLKILQGFCSRTNKPACLYIIIKRACRRTFMKKEYPSYRRTTFEAVKKTLSTENQTIIDNFLNYCQMTAGASSIPKISSKIIQVADIIEKPFGEMTLSDLRQFLAILNCSDRTNETQNDVKKILKRFIRWQFRDWSDRFDGLRDVRMKKGWNDERINSSTLLTDEEIRKLIQRADSIRLKTLIILLSESGARPEEIRHLRWGGVQFHGNFVDVTLHSSKTGKSRTIPLKESAIHLQRWRNEYPFDDVRTTDFVFPSPEDRKRPLSGPTVTGFVERLGKKALGRQIFPYLFRHTMLTKIYKHLSTQVGSKFAGHSPEMSTRYTHLSNDDLREELFSKIYQTEEVSVGNGGRLKELELAIENMRRSHAEEMEHFKNCLSALVAELQRTRGGEKVSSAPSHSWIPAAKQTLS